MLSSTEVTGAVVEHGALYGGWARRVWVPVGSNRPRGELGRRSKP